MKINRSRLSQPGPTTRVALPAMLMVSPAILARYSSQAVKLDSSPIPVMLFGRIFAVGTDTVKIMDLRARDIVVIKMSQALHMNSSSNLLVGATVIILGDWYDLEVVAHAINTLPRNADSGLGDAALNRLDERSFHMMAVNRLHNEEIRAKARRI